MLLLLVLSLVLSTVGFGMARGQAPAVGQMVICTGHGIITVTIDADGNPVRTQTLCPDAALGLLAATAPVAPVALASKTSITWRSWPALTAVPRSEWYLPRAARGPPV
jgi:hypothetical protein